MAVDPLKTDNPLATDAVPKATMSVEFPARVQVGLPSILVLLAMQIAIAVGVVMAAAFVARLAPPLSQSIGSFHRFCVVWLVIGVIVRVLTSHIDVYWFNLLTSVAAAIALTNATILQRDVSASYGTFIMGLMIWNIAEIAIHYTSLDSKIIRTNQEAATRRREQDTTHLFFASIIAGIATCVLLSTSSSLWGLVLVGTVLLAMAVSKASTIAKHPLMFLHVATTNYFLYPDLQDAVPGLIRTEIASAKVRPASLALLLTAIIAVPFVTKDSMPTVGAIAAWLAVAVYDSIAVLCLAASHTARPRHLDTTQAPFTPIVERLRESENPHEQKSYFWGLVEADHSPIVIDRKLFFEHAHILGNTGSGKTSMRLAPLIEQSISFGDMSLFFIDLKADKLENLASCFAAQAALQARTKISIPIKVFTIDQGELSHIFNPFTTAGWSKFSAADKTSIIAEALNLYYGPDYARAHFSAINADVIEECLIANASIASFHELYATLVELAADPTTQVGSMRRIDYVHVAQTIQKLASCGILNATKTSGASAEALDNQIDLASAFQTPGIYYFHLSSITSPLIAQSVARLVTKFLLIAAKSAKRPTKVQIVIDEFQRMIAENLDGFFQLARSHEISVVFANQSLGDLKSSGDKLMQAIEGNCAIRQWLSVTTVSDLEWVAKLFGTHKEINETVTHSRNGTSVSSTLRDAPRITITDLHQISDDPFLSITKITGDRTGYAQYRGIPFVVRSQFHISEDEYKRRLEFEWPKELPGMMEVSELPLPKKPIPQPAKKAAKSPSKKRDKPVDQQPFDDLFI